MDGIEERLTIARLATRRGRSSTLAAVELARTEAAADRELAAQDRAEAERVRDEAAAMMALAAMDELTGAWSRRFGLQELEKLLERAHREAGELVVAFVDVDGLKQVNDAHGHEAGDELLALMGEIIRAHLRPYDVVVRYGGDEFVCATPNLTVEDARARFDQIATVLALLDPEHAISFGIARAEPGESLHRLIIRADTDLLEARSSRRRLKCPNGTNVVPEATADETGSPVGNTRTETGLWRVDGYEGELIALREQYVSSLSQSVDEIELPVAEDDGDRAAATALGLAGSAPVLGLHAIGDAAGAVASVAAAPGKREAVVRVHRTALRDAGGSSERSNPWQRLNHDLRSSLTAVLGYADLLRDHELDPSAAAMVTGILEAGEAMRRRLDDGPAEADTRGSSPRPGGGVPRPSSPF